MATAISMASNALVLIGDDPINSLSDSVAASNLYDSLYEEVLSEHPWSFALKEQDLNRLTAQPDIETGYRYAFQLPSDIIRLWAVFPVQHYDIVGNLLYANALSIFARYLYRPDETILPPHFVKTMEYRLATDFSVSVAEDEEKMKLFRGLYEKSLGSAMAKDSQQKPFAGIRMRGLSRYRGFRRY